MSAELKIQQIRYVLAIIETGGFHAAARQLHRTQPALSMAIRDLEHRLGQALFEKNSHATLTSFGHYCLPRFRELLVQHDRLSQDLAMQVSRQAGQVEIATVPSVASRLMPNILAGFTTAWPGLGVSLYDGNADFVREMVLTGGADLALTSLWQHDERLVFEPLIRDRVGVVCRHDHALAARDDLHWHELKGQTLIRNGTSLLLKDTEAASLLKDSSYFIPNMISLTAMLESGIGITTLPQLAFSESHSALRFIPLHYPVVERVIGLLKPANRTMSPAAEAMEAFILNHLSNGVPVKD
ncbi:MULTISPECIES: LysR family transcriptional regulator [Kushneria]|uniref:LysR family transcriptional regulator n=2 Tax=Kushneria TaxID=504090 RepID=A0A240UNU0_9GAMM|nr:MULTISPECIES: LysR family transcriptional regulator [Kushneria]ARS52506.1 LysR family transcriptional regulator [Kushneria konosiri]ART63177.1 LysR family transcriptional regulator [Kushneria marisflavi]RKD84199.1 LysR family transcriptional regulator [Kushneria marisflavi]